MCTVSFVKRRSRSTEIQHDTSLRVLPTCLPPWQKIFKACSVNGWKCYTDVTRNSQKKHLREVYFSFRRSATYNVMTQMTVLFCLFVFVTHMVESEGYPNRILLSIISQTLRVGVSVHFWKIIPPTYTLFPLCLGYLVTLLETPWQVILQHPQWRQTLKRARISCRLIDYVI